MPIYAYRCSKCGDEVEVMQSMTDPPLKRCKKCRGALKRVFYPVGISFKGSGFYKNDSRSHKRASDEARSEPKSEPKSESKSSKEDKTSTKSDSGTKSSDTRSSDAKSSSASD